MRFLPTTANSDMNPVLMSLDATDLTFTQIKLLGEPPLAGATTHTSDAEDVGFLQLSGVVGFAYL